MMNIFIMILFMLFMAGYYVMSSPAQRITPQETEYAVTQSDMRSIAECAVATHNARIRGYSFDDICVEQNGIRSDFICLNSSMKPTACEIVNKKKPAYSYIITATGNLPENEYNAMMEILEKYYPDAGTFGIIQDGAIMSGGTKLRRAVPAEIIKQMELTTGQLVYMTQYEIPDAAAVFTPPADTDITCPGGTVKTYRFGRWQCTGYNTKTDCGGDMIWDSDLATCVADESRRPLCASTQTAVLVDDVWECVNPFPDKTCPANMVAFLNYSTLEWECVADPGATTDTKKCDTITQQAVYGALGATLRIPTSSCTDCETMVTDYDTCTSICVPDPSRINDPRCYPGNAARDCTGPTRAIYFGFPNRSYVAGVDAVADIAVPLDKTHSQNRKFNCLECPNGTIDDANSRPPYVAVCK